MSWTSIFFKCYFYSLIYFNFNIKLVRMWRNKLSQSAHFHGLLEVARLTQSIADRQSRRRGFWFGSSGRRIKRLAVLSRHVTIIVSILNDEIIFKQVNRKINEIKFTKVSMKFIFTNRFKNKISISWISQAIFLALNTENKIIDKKNTDVGPFCREVIKFTRGLLPPRPLYLHTF